MRRVIQFDWWGIFLIPDELISIYSTIKSYQQIWFIHLESFLFDEFFFDGVGNSKINFQNFSDEHLDNSIFICSEIFLDLRDLFSSLLLKLNFEFLILFLML